MRIEFNDERMMILETRENNSVPWKDIDTVIAYKRDCWSHDQLRLDFATGENVITIVEDDEGFQELLTVLPRYLSGFPALESWCDDVIQPPLKPNATILYSRRKS